LVVEDISYYRATTVFPDLARGTAAPPFTSLGAQARYQMSGGKAVYAYGLDGACLVQQLYPGVDASIWPAPPEGKTAPLANSVAPVWIAPGYSEVGILNEQSAAFNDLAADRQSTLTGAAFGSWVPVTGRWARVRSSSLGVEWSVSALPGAALYGGREQAPPDF